MQQQYWEDLEIGKILETGAITIAAADIIEYATDFDPQPYHLDPVVAETSIFGGHCASGWQVCALMMRLFVDSLNRENIQSSGSTSVDSLRWLMPVFAGDTLIAAVTIVDRKLSTEYPGYGLIDCEISVSNQHHKKVIQLTTDVLVATQGKWDSAND